jgi:hypothetical protein
MVRSKSSKRLMGMHTSLICLQIMGLVNIADWKLYLGEEDELESRMTQMHEGKDDVDINTSNTSTPTHNQISGLITQARARQLNNQVSSFLASYSSYLDNGNMYFVLFLRNDKQE